MSFVVTAKITFLSGLSWATLATPQTISTQPMSAAATRFMDDPLLSSGGIHRPLTLPSPPMGERDGRRLARHLGIDDLFGLRPEDDALLHGLHDEVQGDPERGQDDEHGEDPGDVERKVELENEVAEPALGAH